MSINQKELRTQQAEMFHPALPLERIDVRLATEGYPIFVGKNCINRLPELFDLSRFSHIGVVTDENVAAHWLPELRKAVPGQFTEIIIKPGEQEKNISTALTIWGQLMDAKFDRKSLLLTMGGGVVSDLGGFAAATFMRGIPVLHIPTTLLAQVDASAGGKTGINFSDAKNTIGVFHQPIGVMADVDTLSTLPIRELLSGMAEVIKHGIIDGRKHLEQIRNMSLSGIETNQLIDIIARSCRIKSSIVALDERDSSVRKILNFGHTVGHAIESLSQSSDSPLLHGEAVSIGMAAESCLAEIIGLLPSEDARLIETSLKDAGLPVRVRDIPVEAIMEKMQKDKKNERDTILWSLPTQIGHIENDIRAPESAVRDALAHISN